MPLTPEQRTQVADELKKFGSDLNLSDDQKSKLETYLIEAREKVQVYVQQNPNISKADVASRVAANRDAIRQKLVNFFTPEQLAKWDDKVANAKEFLGQKIAA